MVCYAEYADLMQSTDCSFVCILLAVTDDYMHADWSLNYAAIILNRNQNWYLDGGGVCLSLEALDTYLMWSHVNSSAKNELGSFNTLPTKESTFSTYSANQIELWLNWDDLQTISMSYL